MSRDSEADKLAFKALDGDHGGQGDHEHRMRQLAYAQVQATLHLAEQVQRAADALEAIEGKTP